jgi:hypothetical protein
VAIFEGGNCDIVPAPVSMLFPPIDPNEQFRARRAATRRRKRLRRAALFGTALAGIVLVGAGAQVVGGDRQPAATDTAVPDAALLAASPDGPRSLPLEVRGVHVTMGLASLAGKLEEYVDLEREGLTAIELDVKEENGRIGFRRGAPSLARSIGAAQTFYDARRAARLVHSRGLYLVGRIVVFEDPILALARPDLAVRRSDGSVWRDSAGLGWANPYDRRVWKYNVDLAIAAAQAGFDEILFDYVRFPSDGDVAAGIYRNPSKLAKIDAVSAFLRYAGNRLEPLGVRMSAAVFGLSAARDLGIGQIPKRIAPHVDAVYAMTYPSLFGPGEFALTDPSATPGATVSEALVRFKRALRKTDALLLTWVQDFSFTRSYELEDVRAQVEAARLAGAKGFMLWNAEGVYTDGALAPAAPS